MALVLKDRVRETSTSTGTGAFTLNGAVAGFQSFSAVGAGNQTYYTIAGTTDWEVGIGTWTSPNQLSRDTVLASTNAGALVTFGSGTKDVFLTFPAEGFAVPPAIGGTTPNAITGTIITGTDYIAAAPSKNIYTTSSYDPISGVYIGAGQFIIDDIQNTSYQAIFSIDGIWKDDGLGSQYPMPFPYGISTPIVNSNIDAPGYIEIGPNFSGAYPAQIRFLSGGSPSWNSIDIVAPANNAVGATSYVLTLPLTAGSNNQVLKTDGTGILSWTTQGVQGTAPVTVTAATYTVAATDQWIIGNRAGTITLTLPTASTNTGRSLNIKTIQAQTVVSASSNVVPLNGGAAGTAILAATIGKYATLVSDGTNWIIMQAN